MLKENIQKVKIGEEKIHQKSKQLTFNDREKIADCLNRGFNLTSTAYFLNCDISTIKKEIDRNKELLILEKSKNKCGLKKVCNYHNLCGLSRCTRACSTCIQIDRNCNRFCDNFTNIPNCKKLKHLCGVCNGCDEKHSCTLNRWYYKYHEAQKAHEMNLTSVRTGISISEDELKVFTSFLTPLVKRNLSLDSIKAMYPLDFPYTIQTVYNWINKGYISGVDNLLLPRKVKYKARAKKKIQSKNDYSYLQGRYYEDFKNYTTDHPYDEVVEMDTVEGVDKKSYILTLLFRRSNFMLAFKLKDHSSNSVLDIFKQIREYLGVEVFKMHFPVILTDRGSEFKSPEMIEFDDFGEHLTNVFYCDSRQSQQKGKIEKNHEEIRKICPKGFDFNSITQSKLNLVLNHVNSYPRKILNYKTPIELFKIYANEKMLDLNDSKMINFNNLELKPSLLKH